jgi:hypothetical protein
VSGNTPESVSLVVNSGDTMRDEDEISAKRQRQREYFWKHIWAAWGYVFAFLAVLMSPLLVGKYFSHAWGGCTAIILAIALLYLGIKIGVLTRGHLFTRIIWLMIPAMEILYAVFLFSVTKELK